MAPLCRWVDLLRIIVLEVSDSREERWIITVRLDFTKHVYFFAIMKKPNSNDTKTIEHELIPGLINVSESNIPNDHVHLSTIYCVPHQTRQNYLT